MAKQLLIEYILFKPTPQSINEARINPSKNLFVEGIIQRANSKNQNGRIYPYETLKREVDKYIKGPIAENRSLAELDHPTSGTPSDQTISLKNVSHIIRKLWWINTDLMARIEVLPTPSGNIAKELFLNEVTVGISSRCMGSVKQIDENTVEVEPDLDLICFDFVSTPSTYGAFLKPIGLNENYIPTVGNKYDRVNEIISNLICDRLGFCECEVQ